MFGFNEIGEKLKGLAKTLFIIEIIVCYLAGIVFLVRVVFVPKSIFIALALMILGPVFAWINNWVLYGFGELVDRVCKIEHALCGTQVDDYQEEDEDYDA